MPPGTLLLSGMKKILILLVAGVLLLTQPVRAQDAAVEERLNKLTVQLEDLQAARVKLEKQIAELNREVSTLREQASKPTGNFASPEDLRKLAEKLQEIDQKRVSDNEKILKEIEKLGKTGGTTGGKKPLKLTPAAHVENPAGSGSAEKGFKYVIQSGDTLSTIAQAYREKGLKIYPEQILKANDGLKERSLKPGQEIFIPAPAQ
jgi:LysM repeat protein